MVRTDRLCFENRERLSGILLTHLQSYAADQDGPSPEQLDNCLSDHVGRNILPAQAKSREVSFLRFGISRDGNHIHARPES
jgi:hypothetical protein